MVVFGLVVGCVAALALLVLGISLIVLCKAMAEDSSLERYRKATVEELEMALQAKKQKLNQTQNK